MNSQRHRTRTHNRGLTDEQLAQQLAQYPSLSESDFPEVNAEVKASPTSVSKKRKLQIDPRIAKMFQGTSLPEDFDEKKAYGEYLYQKYK